MNLFPENYLFKTNMSKAFELGISTNSIPDFSYITDNLRFPIFEWQRKALVNFFINEVIRETEEDTSPTHLLFNMATGSGKTLVMAATILYY